MCSSELFDSDLTGFRTTVINQVLFRPQESDRQAPRKTCQVFGFGFEKLKKHRLSI